MNESESQSQDSNNVPTTDPLRHRTLPLVIISEDQETELDVTSDEDDGDDDLDDDSKYERRTISESETIAYAADLAAEFRVFDNFISSFLGANWRNTTLDQRDGRHHMAIRLRRQLEACTIARHFYINYNSRNEQVAHIATRVNSYCTNWGIFVIECANMVIERNH